MLATPIRILDVLVGEFGWLVLRLALGSVAFFLVMLLFGTVHSGLAVLAILVGAILAAGVYGLSYLFQRRWMAEVQALVPKT